MTATSLLEDSFVGRECCECGRVVPGLSAGGRCEPCEIGPHLELLAELATTPAPAAREEEAETP